MEKILELYKYVDGVNDAPFPNDKEQVVISSFRYDAKRMGGAPTISCSFMHHLCLDKMWDYNVYAIFNGEKYFVKQIPTSSYDNTDSRYKHELELASERVILDNVYVYDVVDSGSSYDKPVSNSSKFAFFGDIHEFTSRLNQSLKYSKVGYSVVVDEGITSEPKMVSFQDQFFSNAIQESYNTFNIPYYFVGKVIHFGYTNNAITNTFKYGQDESLLSIQKQNANYKSVNRVTGVGSEDNIPYYYPNDYESKEEVEANGGTWVNPQTNLMPSIYRESLGDERFYNALNNTYRIPNSDKYYEFANPYVEGKPKEHIVNFEDIKPTIKGVTNAEGLRIDMFSEFAFDENDNDEFDEEGNYLHPYFFARLRKFDGEHGFNLFDHSIDEQEMTISMTSGSCGACEFVIGADESTQKNIVQVDDNGNLLRDNNGNVKFGNAQDRQNDTSKYEVWIALRKDVDTFGVIMPNATYNYKPSVNDTFVILHIDLPKAYILAAEDKLEKQLIEYMSLNNSEKFNFSISFSRIFFAENPDVLSQLNENARIQIEYDNTLYELYISSYSYSMSNDKPLPEIRVELTDTLTITQNALQTAISEVKNEILASGGGSFDFLKQGLKYFLRKDVSDKTPHSLGVGKDLSVGGDATIEGTTNSREVIAKDSVHSEEFVSGFTGGKGWAIRFKEFLNAAGITEEKAVAEFDDVIVRGALRVYEFIVSQMLGENDNRIFTGMMEVDHYDATDGKVYLKTDNGRLYNPFRVDDVIIVQQYGGNPSEENGYYVTKQYEFIVTEVGIGEMDEDRLDWIRFRNFTTSMEGGNESLISERDTLVRIDNLSDANRKGIIQLMSVGEDTPYMDFVYGAKTDPENSLKGRFGNLGGVYNPLFGWLKEFGAYLTNLYAVGEFRIAHTGEDIADAIEILKGTFRTNFSQTSYDITEEADFFTNATFTNDCEYWELSEEETSYFAVGDVPQFFNYELYASESSFAGLSEYDGRSALRLTNGYAKQLNDNIRKPSTHIEYSDVNDSLEKVGEEVVDTLYLSVRIYAATDSIIELGFTDSNGSFIENDFHHNESLQANKDGYTINLSGKWDGEGDFTIRGAGDIYIDHLSLTDKPLENFRITTSTAIEQDAKSIKLLGEKVDNVSGAITTVQQTVDAQKGEISSVAKRVSDTETSISSLTISVNGISSEVSKKVDGDKIASTINQTAQSVKIAASKIELTGQVTFSMLDSSTQSTINSKVTQSNVDSSITAFGNTIIEGGYIKTTLINADAIVAKQLQATDEYGNILTVNSTGLFITGKERTERVRLRGDAASAYLRIKSTAGHTSDLYASGLSFTYGDYSTIITYSGITLGNGCNIKGFKLGNTSPTSVKTDTDFIRTGSSIALPAPSSCWGKVIFTRTTAECTISSTGKNIYPRSGALTESFTRTNTAQFFISDGTYWYEFYCG